MRKILTAAWVGVFFLTGSVCYGQVTPTLGPGTTAVLFTFDGLNFLRADSFDGGAGFKYFLSEENALRVGLVSIGATSCAPDAGSPGTVVYEGARLIFDGRSLVADDQARSLEVTSTERSMNSRSRSSVR